MQLSISIPLLFLAFERNEFYIPTFWVNLFIGAVAAVIVINLIKWQINHYKTKKKSILTEGTVTYVKSTYKFTLKYGFREDIEIRVRFKDLQGGSYDQPCKNHSFDFIEVKQGDKVKIFYNPNNPNDFYATLKDS